jgi:hypothetical protein
MSVHKPTARSGYDYLTRQVAALLGVIVSDTTLHLPSWPAKSVHWNSK